MTQNKELNLRFGANLRRERHAAGVSQETLAFRAGLHRTEIALLERGGRQPRLTTIVKLASALMVPPAVLMEGISWQVNQEKTSGHFVIDPGKPED